MPSRSLKLATDFLARVMTGFWPALAIISEAAVPTRFLSWVASPTPMLMTILSTRGPALAFAYPNYLGSAHDCTTVNNAHLVSRLLLVNNNIIAPQLLLPTTKYLSYTLHMISQH